VAELRRIFTWPAIATLTVGSVIGSGIFLVPSAVLRDSGGSVGLSTVVWIVGGILSCLGALTYAELAAMNPGSGGLYLYLRDAFGPAVAFAYGWTLFAVIGAGTVATLSVASSAYLGVWIPMAPSTHRLLGALIAFLVSAINVPGTRQSSSLIKLGTAIKLGAIALLTVALPVLGAGFSKIDRVWPEFAAPGLASSAGLALVSVLWAYEGWQYLTFITGETIEPQRNFPRGLVLGVFGLILVYVLASLAYVAALGPAGVMASDRVAADAAGAILGGSWARIISIPIVVSMLTAAQANSMLAARVYFAMANDGIFFGGMARVHPRFETPAFALLSAGAWSAVLAASGTFEVLLQYVVFMGWLFYGLGGLSVLVLRRRRPDALRPFRVPGYPLTPILFAASALAIVVNTVIQSPVKGMIGLGATAAAFPIYLIWRGQARRPA
jgi:APA family basic amino acid/polyamine antiporter